MRGVCTVDEIADGIFRISALCDGWGRSPPITCNQFLLYAEEPLLFHTGPQAMFPAVRDALSRVLPLTRLRWISFGHVEADECGSLRLLSAAAPRAHVCFGPVGTAVSVRDLSSPVPVTAVDDGAAIDLGGRRVRLVLTPHAPHNWESQVLFEEVTETLLCGDLVAQSGPGPAVTGDAAVVERALATEATLRSSTPGSVVPATLRRLAPLEPRVLATMHGSAFEGDGRAVLLALADAWDTHPFD